MTFQRFLMLLGITIASAVLLNFSLTFLVSKLSYYNSMGFWSIFLFTIISFVLFFLGQQAAKSSNKMLFNNVIMASVFLKMMAAVVILLVYKKVNHPESNVFLIPFFIAYFFFSIFETYFMVKLSKNK
jgi:hypothetical protein